MYEEYALADFIDDVQGLLDDDGTYYSDALCTHAIRRALHRINQVTPMFDSITLTTESGVLEYTLDDFENMPITVQSVILTSAEADPDPFPQGFYFYRINGTTPTLRLRVDYGSYTDYLTVRYAELHTINLLDDAGITSLPDWIAQILIIGAGGFAAQQRVASRVEANNLDDQVPSALLSLANSLLTNFELMLAPYAREKPPGAAIQQNSWELDNWKVT